MYMTQKNKSTQWWQLTLIFLNSENNFGKIKNNEIYLDYPSWIKKNRINSIINRTEQT